MKLFDCHRSTVVPSSIICLCLFLITAPVYALDLHGTYINFGINSDGSLVNDAITLGATFPDSPSVEFFVPGTPYEGWAVGVNGSLYLANFAPASSSQIPVTVTDTSSGSTRSALVTGTADFGGGRSLAIRRTIAFSIDGTSVTFRIELTNTGTATLTRVAFMEGGDPDQGVGIGVGFETRNDVVFDGQFVRAWVAGGVFPSGLTVGLGTCDQRSVLSVESPWIQNPYGVLDSPVDPGDSVDDAEICLAFDFGTLGVGQTVSAEYHMIFGRTVSEADDKFEEICPQDNLVVTPAEGLNSTGFQGGPFTPSGKDYTLDNTGVAALDWTAETDVPWLDVTPDSGTLLSGENVIVTVSFNENANGLDVGHYNGEVVFTNVTSDFRQTREIMLTVSEIPPPPPEPSNPNPADGAVLVNVNTLLSWNGGGGGGSELLNGGFETRDFTGWTTVTGPGEELRPWTVATEGSGYFANGIPFEGIYFAQNGFDGEAGLFYDIYQEIAIPPGTSSAQLVWSERLQWDLTYGATVERPYEVTLQPAGGGSPLAVLFSTVLPPGTTGDTGYVTHSVNLLAAAPGIAGQTIRINFHQYIPETYTGPAQFDLDGVSLIFSDGLSVRKIELSRPSYNKASTKAGMLPGLAPSKDRSAYLKIKEKTLASKKNNDKSTINTSDRQRGKYPLVSSVTPVNAAQDTRLSYEAPHAIANVAIFQNYDPWDSTKNQDVLIANGISYTIYDSSAMGVVDLSIYDKVIIASFQDSDFYAVLRANIGWFENYVAAGGILDIHAATQGDQPLLPGGFGITFSPRNAVTIVDTDHPVVTTPHIITNAELNGWNYSVHGYISMVPSGAHEILRGTDSGQPCAMELNLGLGRIFVTTQTVEWVNASYNYIENTILYGTTGVPATFDVYFGTVNPPVTLIHTGLTVAHCQPVPYPLAYQTTYYWQVVATNPGGQTDGNVWSFTTMGPPGEIEVTDSILPVNDLNMPFGNVVINTAGTEHITIANTHGTNALVVSNINLAGSAFRLQNVPALPVEVPHNGSISFDVIFEPNNLQQYSASVSIASNDTDEPMVTVALSGSGVFDYLTITPSGDITFSGHPGGPFMPSKVTYTLHNTSATQTMCWSASKTAGWFDVSPLGGSVAPGGSVSVTAKPNSTARTLQQGVYTDILLFTNHTTSAQHNCNVSLNVFIAPKMGIDPPDGFNVSVRQGETLTETLTISNSGDANLSFTLSSQELPSAPLTAASPVAEIASGDNEMVFEYSFSRPLSRNNGNFDLLKMTGLELLEQVGAPIVPVRPVKILVPYGKQVVDCTVAAQDMQQLPVAFILQPAQKPYPLNYKGPIEMTLPDEKIYKSSSLWPGKYFEKIGTQSKRGYQVFVLNLLPLQYVPATGRVSYASKLILTITLADAKQTAMVFPSESAKAKIAASVENLAALESYPSADNLQKTGYSPLLPPGGPYQYVVITNQALRDAPGPNNFQALCNARTADGLPATIVTTEWIYANYNGTKPSGGSDNQTRIRNFLIDAYQNWGTQYVLLGGTNAIVPARLFWVDSYAGEVDNMPVDMYYGCVDPPTCTFDYDADGSYGEPTDGPGGGEVDLFGEIYVGRAPVENAAELANFVNKTLTYNATQQEYLPRIAMVGEYLGFGGVSDYATDSMEQIRTGGTFDGYYTCGFEENNQPAFIDFNTIGNMPGVDPCCFWPLYDAPGYDWPTDRLTCLMNGGIHVFNHLGHTNETYCMKLYTSDLPALSNTDYFFVYSQGCYPGAFDTTNCFAEVLTTMSHGAFGAIMNARYGWGMSNSTDGPSERFARQFWDAPLGEGILEIGRANQDSKEDNIWGLGGACIRWCLYELNLFGDSAQKFRFAQGARWLTLTPEAGIVAPAGAMDVNVVFSSGNLELGEYYGQIEIKSNDNYNSTVTMPVTMTIISSAFAVTPEDGLVATGVMGGPFEPGSKIYTLTNSGDEPRNWQALTDAPWLAIEPNQGTLAPGFSQDVEVRLNNDAYALEPAAYTAVVTFRDLLMGRDASRDVNLNVTVPDFFTELFDAKDNDVNHLTLTLVPDDSGHFYTACIREANAFHVDPAGGTMLTLRDDDYAEITPAGGMLIPFYRQNFDVFYVGSNGYVSFDTGDVDPVESFEQHFLYKRISALYDDLNPAAGGTVSWKQTADEVAVTYYNVPEYGLSSHNSFQIEMFFDGTIRITWLDIAARDGLVGLSPGNGLADYFVESDISDYGSCLRGDLNLDGNVDLADMAFFAEYWLNNQCTLVNGYCEGCDSGRNGVVDFKDFSDFGDAWFDAL